MNGGVRTPTCEGEEVLDHEAVRMASRLIAFMGLQSHAPMRPRPAAPTVIKIPRHLKWVYEGQEKRLNSIFAYTCNCMSIFIYVTSGLRTN